MTLHHRFLIGIVGLSCSVAATSQPGVDAGYDRPTGYHRTVEWRSEEETARGLFFFQSGASGLVRRVLVETPDGRHLVLSKALLPRVGLDRELLLDEESGWNVELVKRFPYRAASLGDYFRQVLDGAEPSQDEGIRFSFATNDGFSFAASVPMMSQPRLEHHRFARLLTEDARANGRFDVPESLKPSVRFLEQAFETEISDSRGIIEILSAALGVPSARTDSSWRQIDGAAVPGLVLGDGEAIEFASEFPSIDPLMPLPEDRLDQLTENPVP